ncbi:MAG: hypothetical protein IKF90_24715 [Parasporobacterium sp.]|nr:hypothetical protein [Parasporobacterium sp.]
MENIPVKALIIDDGFKNLIRPLYKQEYLQLEENLLAYGCREPIAIWNGVIVDGHNRYEICTRHNIPFETEEMPFECREEAIAWICANQLGRRNLTEETRKFLIGMQYENEKIVNSRKNALGVNQYFSPDESTPYEEYNPAETESIAYSKNKTAKKIADANHISHGTVEKYAIYTRALEEIGKKEPLLVPKILSGRFKVSHKNILVLAKYSAEELKSINLRLERIKSPFAQYQTTRKEIQENIISDSSVKSIKDMPVYDPDAEITGLTLTIPSWTSSIIRVKDSSSFHSASGQAKRQLTDALADHMTVISDMLATIRKESL